MTAPTEKITDETRVKELTEKLKVAEEALDLVIPRCATKINYSDAFSAKVTEQFEKIVLIAESNKSKKENIHFSGCEKYFAPRTIQILNSVRSELENIKNIDVHDLLLLSILSILRKCSFANVKKMNLELDLNKKKVQELLPTWKQSLEKNLSILSEISNAYPKRPKIEVLEHSALSPFTIEDKPADLAILHPPYLTNTAFSESTQLQLAFLNIDHKTIWKKELRCRGSFLHEPNGLKKYLVDWHKILSNTHKALRKKGKCAVVIGDGRIDYVRIPIGAITNEFLKDIGFKVEKQIVNNFNNQTGQTQNKKMTIQHILIASKE